MSMFFFLNSSKMNPSCGCANTQHVMNGGGEFESQHQGGGMYLDELANLAIPMSFLLALNFMKKKKKVKETRGGGDLKIALASLGARIEGILSEANHLKSG